MRRPRMFNEFKKIPLHSCGNFTLSLSPFTSFPIQFITKSIKVLATNPEAKNAAAVLNSKADTYMLNPCNKFMWMVVELCEPVLVHRVVVENLELFSSMAATMRVYVSTRYAYIYLYMN